MATSIDLARRLLREADSDELIARSLLPVQGVADARITSLTEQAVGNAIKAVLAAKGITFRFSHNLDHLATLCKVSGVALPVTLDAVNEPTPLPGSGRDGSPAPAGRDREQALTWAMSTIAWAHEIVEQCEATHVPTAADPEADGHDRAARRKNTARSVRP